MFRNDGCSLALSRGIFFSFFRSQRCSNASRKVLSDVMLSDALQPSSLNLIFCLCLASKRELHVSFDPLDMEKGWLNSGNANAGKLLQVMQIRLLNDDRRGTKSWLRRMACSQSLTNDATLAKLPSKPYNVQLNNPQHQESSD